MDEEQFLSAYCQRPYQYLQLYLDKQNVNINVNAIHGTPDGCVQCIMTLVLYSCSILSIVLFNVYN